jgi:hypothetical protein
MAKLGPRKGGEGGRGEGEGGAEQDGGNSLSAEKKCNNIKKMSLYNL